MKTSTKQFKLYILGLCTLVISILLPACDIIRDDNTQSLAANLDRLLETNGNSQGKAYFKMPASDDYSNIPQDPRNPITAAKVKLGQLLFHETGLLADAKRTEGLKTASCASCHHADAGFQAGIVQGIGEGGLGFGVHGEGRIKDPTCPVDMLDIQPIRSPSAMNAAWQTNVLWNGQFGATGINVGTNASWTAGTPKEKNLLGYEGIETQAIAGQNVHRLNVSAIKNDATYQALYAAAFPNSPASDQMNQVNTGLAIAAYERTLLANESPFQRYLRGESQAMSAQELQGAILFFGKAQCVSCHYGPALNSMKFYALGMNDLIGDGIYGSDATKAEHKGRAGFTGNALDMFKFKVPQLYNLADSKFYGHGGTFRTIRDVVAYKNNGIPQKSEVASWQLANEFRPLGLTSSEVDAITTFLEVSLHDPNLKRYVPKSLPTGQAFPDNDVQSRKDLKF